jgi:hypothetical protein
MVKWLPPMLVNADDPDDLAMLAAFSGGTA